MLRRPPHRMKNTDSVEAYLSAQPDGARAAWERIRGVVKALSPEATESISYQMPTFKHQGKALLGFAVFKQHYSVFPYSRGVMVDLEKELSGYDTSGNGATIRFVPEKPLPLTLLRKIVKTRIAEIEAGGEKAAATRRPRR